MFCELGASPYGVCEMIGSVAEWAADGYDSELGYEGLSDVNPFREPTAGRVSRRSTAWGSWGLSAAGYPRASQRWGGGSNTDESSPGGPETLEQGFRCARSD